MGDVAVISNGGKRGTLPSVSTQRNGPFGTERLDRLNYYYYYLLLLLSVLLRAWLIYYI